jgi:hypothetical protein
MQGGVIMARLNKEKTGEVRKDFEEFRAKYLRMV